MPINPNTQQGQVLCIGELLIDFICTDINVNLAQGNSFLKQAGGAPANVAAAISRLGGKAAFVGKVGDDPFGDFLIETLNNEKVDTSMVSKDSSGKTTMAFVSLQSGGERDFVFNRGADGNLSKSDIPLNRLKESAIVHFGSATAMLGGTSLDTYFSIMEFTAQERIFVSFDPNYRSNLWQGRLNEFIERSKRGVSHADFVKVSEEELLLITGRKERSEGVNELHQLGAHVVAVTFGKEGTLVSIGEHQALVPSISVTSVDSTGAGDAFVGGVLFQLAQYERPQDLAAHFEQWKEFIRSANKIGALVCTKMGAITALPTFQDIWD